MHANGVNDASPVVLFEIQRRMSDCELRISNDDVAQAVAFTTSMAVWLIRLVELTRRLCQPGTTQAIECTPESWIEIGAELYERVVRRNLSGYAI